MNFVAILLLHFVLLNYGAEAQNATAPGFLFVAPAALAGSRLNAPMLYCARAHIPFAQGSYWMTFSLKIGLFR
jgi:hypothetical protein